MFRKILAVDPGSPPTLCFREVGGYKLAFYENHSVAKELTHKTKGGNIAKSYATSPVMLASLIYELNPDLVVVERVSMYQGEGVSSGAKLLGSMYLVVGICAGLNIPLMSPTPSVWKRDMDLPGKMKPNANETIRSRAANLFPSVVQELRRKMDHNRAEALLLTVWAEKHPDYPLGFAE